MSYIDSHAHLSSPSFAEDSKEVLQRALEAGVEAVVNICTDRASLESGLNLAVEYPWIYNAAATPPHDVVALGAEDFPFIAQHARLGHLKAIGETGLDYYYYHAHRDQQQEYLKKYLELALECQLPVVIHCRDAFSDFFSILDSDYKLENGSYGPGALHCFTGSCAEAEELLKRGWYISFSGIVTFKKSAELRAVAKMVPLESMLIETDSPYLAPQTLRGKRNEPSFLPEVAQVIAEVKGCSLEEVSFETSKNTRRLFSI